MKHLIEIDLHEAKKSIDNICLLGCYTKDEKAKEFLHSLNDYVQDIWSKILTAQQNHNNQHNAAT